MSSDMDGNGKTNSGGNPGTSYNEAASYNTGQIKVT